MKTIDIIIAPSGQSRVETRGFTGDQCRDASRFLETALGTTASETLTAEFYQAQSQQQNHLEQET
jgi:hypothetical protein